MSNDYQINVVYEDTQQIEIYVAPDQINDFCSAVGSGVVWFDYARGEGIWINIHKVRYFSVKSPKLDAAG